MKKPKQATTYWAGSLRYRNHTTEEEERHLVVISESPQRFVDKCLDRAVNATLEVLAHFHEISLKDYQRVLIRTKEYARSGKRKPYKDHIASNYLDRDYLAFNKDDRIYVTKTYRPTAHSTHGIIITRNSIRVAN